MFISDSWSLINFKGNNMDNNVLVYNMILNVDLNQRIT